ncbi:MAG: hypothetical protein DRJ26_04700, partial [Candidatus Methanomethylicota archaeon]
TDEIEDAIIVAKRKGKRIVVLIVNADKLRARGYAIYKAGKNTYLVNYVPPDCIDKVEVIT